MNPFKIGDRVRFSYKMFLLEILSSPDKFPFHKSPSEGEEFIVTCLDVNCIGFKSKYADTKELKKGKKPWFPIEFFILVRPAEDISFDKQAKDILNG